MKLESIGDSLPLRENVVVPVRPLGTIFLFLDPTDYFERYNSDKVSGCTGDINKNNSNIHSETSQHARLSIQKSKPIPTPYPNTRKDIRKLTPYKDDSFLHLFMERTS